MRRLAILAALGLVVASPALASKPVTPIPTEQTLRYLESELRLARDFGTCLARCAERGQRCLAAAQSKADRDRCRIRESECESFCGQFSR